MTAAALVPADGPADPPSSRPGSGVLGGQVLAYRFDPSLGIQHVDVPGLDGIAIDDDTVVHWAFYADGADAVHAPHAALAVTVDVVFDDGTRMSDEPRTRDRYGFGMDAASQFAAAWSMPEQWNADTVSLAPWAGRRARVVVVLGTDDVAVRRSAEANGFVEVVAERAPAAAGESPADRVDTRRGSHSGSRFSRGNTIPAVAVPHGFCFVTPATDAADSRWPYRPFVHDDPAGRRLEAVQFSHQPSPWIGDRGVLQLMPFTGQAASDRTARRHWIVRGTERARPHEYAADLVDGSRLEVTATDHGGAFRIKAGPDANVGFIIDQLTDDGALRFHDGGAAFEGWIAEGPADWGNAPRTYFAGYALGGVAGSGSLHDAGRGKVAGYVAGTGVLEVRVALSFLSLEQARRTLHRELGAETSFDDLRDALRMQWDDLLGAVSLPPASAPGGDDARHRALADAEDRARLASALYRLHLYPNRASEDVDDGGALVRQFADPMVAAGPHGDDETGAPVREGELFVNNGYWDTYRTCWPTLAMLDPEHTGRMLDGLLQQWRTGGWMPRWSAPGYVDSMVGTSSDQIFADGERWGARFDAGEAFESAWRDACEPSADSRWGRKGIARGRFRGYIEREIPEGMSWSLENAISDAAIARLATRLADGLDSLPSQDVPVFGAESGTIRDGSAARRMRAARYRAYARYFENRARSYRMLFDPEHGFFRGRDADGAFGQGAFDPRVWGGDNVETNGWGMSVSAVHDGHGLAALYGGPAGLRAHLDRLFAEPETGDEAFGGSYGTVIHEQREARALRSGMCAISNQPAHHIPWMHVFGDQPWRAGAEVHGLARRLFAGAMIGQGFPGDEDNGEMSAWWLWAGLGLYPLELASGMLRIGCPLFDDIVVRRAGGVELRVRSHRSVPDARYLVAARLDGEMLDRAELEIDALVDGAVLDLEFSDSAEEAAASPLWQRAVAPPDPWRADLTTAAGAPIGDAALFDDAADSPVSLAPGDSAGWRFGEPRRVTDVTLTAAAETPEHALTWEASDDGISWRVVTTTHHEPLLADRTTPFTFTAPVSARMLRVRATDAVDLRQLELFDLGNAEPA
ncbi:glycoside hydrolase domain-containing protein [Microbacterium aurantiacum]|uniref:glycoside hydrolase domain-containing protein n=1 Tax=Microbacterium aurantiacum TaxID=162393 RepID=UPI000C80D306|nr:glycoside hydrolase domain-containing protein [Microbacterium aurantiacum]